MTNVEEMCPDWGLARAYISAKKEVEAHPPWAGEKSAHGWNPYSFEGGTIAGIAGEDFAVIASDGRMAKGEMCVVNRETTKLFIQNDKVLLGGCMFYGDMKQLDKLLKATAMRFEFDHHEEMSADVMAEYLSRSLYQRRFFPYYAWTLIGGIDSKGKGAIYSYDPIGCLERCQYSVAGNGRNFIEPMLDNQVAQVTMAPGIPRMPVTVERATKILRDAFIATAERETNTGDRVHIVTFQTGKPPVSSYVKLRED